MSNIMKYILIGLLAVILFPLVVKLLGMVFSITSWMFGGILTLLIYALIGWVIHTLWKKYKENK